MLLVCIFYEQVIGAYVDNEVVNYVDNNVARGMRRGDYRVFN